MKNKLVTFSVLLALVFVTAGLFSASLLFSKKSHASNLQYNQNVNVYKKSSGNLYVAGNSLSVNNKILGDVIFFGSNSIVNNTISQDFIDFSGTTLIDGTVLNNAYIVSGNIILNGKVREDLVSLGGNIDISKSSTVYGNLYALGGEVLIDGKIIHNAYINAGHFVLNGHIGGNLKLSSNNVKINKGSSINGYFSYTGSDNKSSYVNKNSIKGHIYRNYTNKDQKEIALTIARTVLIFLAMIIFVLLFIKILPKLSLSVVKNATDKTWTSFGYGFIEIIVTPVIAVILLLTIIGIPISIFLIGIYILLMFVSYMLNGLILGAFITKYLYKMDAGIRFRSAFAGIFISSLISIIPIIGGLYNIFIGIIIFGAFSLIIKNYISRI